MALQLAARRPWGANVQALVPGAAVGLSIVGGVLVGLWLPINGRNDGAEHKLCDRAVAALLHSKEPVEVERAGIIIRQVNCGIGQRLTENGE